MQTYDDLTRDELLRLVRDYELRLAVGGAGLVRQSAPPDPTLESDPAGLEAPRQPGSQAPAASPVAALSLGPERPDGRREHAPLEAEPFPRAPDHLVGPAIAQAQAEAERLGLLEQRAAVLDGLADGVILANAAGRIIYHNSASLDFHGYASLDDALLPREAILRQWELSELDGQPLPFEDWPLPRALRGERFDNWELYLRERTTGAERIASYSGRLLREPDGQPRVAVLTVHDITERKRAERKLAQSEARFRRVFEHAGTGIAITDWAGRFRRCNPAYCKLVGYSESELARMDFLSLVHPEDRDTKLGLVRQLRDGELTFFEVENRYVRKDGTPVRVHKHYSVLPDETGAPAYLLALVTDVTERWRMAEALRQSEARYRELVESVNSAIVHWTPDGTIAFFNEHAERLFGYRAEEVIGRDVRILIPETETTGRDLKGLVDEIVAHPERHRSVVAENLCRDGRRIWMVWTNRPLRDERGEVVGILAVGSDATEIKATEAALKLADRRKDEFLATLAHELRNPLAPLLTGIALQRLKSEDPAVAGRTLDAMERQVRHLVRLVEDLSDVSRIRRGTLELRIGPVDLAAAIGRAIEIVRPTGAARGRELILSLPDEPLTVDGDEVRLVQIVTNLLNNAVKFTLERGRIRIALAREGDWARLSVQDDGEGMTPELLSRIFDMFAQGDSNRAGGLGIGLALVRSLATLHGGSVEARSQGPGRGSELIVRLPLAAGPSAVAPADAPERVLRAVPKTGRRVLIVDDNRDVADSLGMLLGAMGAQVLVVYDGSAALETFDAERPDTVLVDIGMPGMDGCEVARHLRARCPDGDLVLVAVTGWGHDGERKRILDAGFDRWLVKPVGLERLRELLGDPWAP